MLGQGEHRGAVPWWSEQGQEQEQKTGGGGTDDPWEEEKSWRDPSAHSIRSLVVKWMDTRHALADLAKVNSLMTFIPLFFLRKKNEYRHKARENALMCNRTSSSCC